MKNLIFTAFCTLTFLTLSSHAQTVVPDNIRATNAFDQLMDGNGLGINEIIYGIAVPPTSIIGDIYLFKELAVGSVLFYKNNALARGLKIKYDTYNQELLLLNKNQERVANSDLVKSFVLINPTLTLDTLYFVNTKELNLKSNSFPKGFVEVLSEGKTPLIRAYKTRVKKSNYNAALNTGNLNDQLIQESDLFYLKENELMPVKRNKKSLLSIFNDAAADINSFIEQNQIDIKSDLGVKQVFNHYNSLRK